MIASSQFSNLQLGNLAIWQLGNIARNAELTSTLATFKIGNFQFWQLSILATFNVGNFFSSISFHQFHFINSISSISFHLISLYQFHFIRIYQIKQKNQKCLTSHYINNIKTSTTNTSCMHLAIKNLAIFWTLFNKFDHSGFFYARSLLSSGMIKIFFPNWQGETLLVHSVLRINMIKYQCSMNDTTFLKVLVSLNLLVRPVRKSPSLTVHILGP